MKIRFNLKTSSLHFCCLAVLFFLAFFPLYRQTKLTPEGAYYTKLHRIHEDYYFYLSVIHQGRKEFNYVNQYTTEINQTTRFHLFYLILGRMGSYLNVTDVWIYYAAMSFSLILYYIFSYQLIKLVIPKKFIPLTLLIVFLASPFPPWQVRIWGNDLNLGQGWWTYMDAYSRLTLLPHHFFSGALTVAAAYFFLKFYRQKVLYFALWSSLTLFLGIVFFTIPGVIFLVALSGFLFLLILEKLWTYLFTAIKNRKLPSWRMHRNYLYGLLMMYLICGLALFFVGKQLVGSGYPSGGFIIGEYNTFRAEQYPYTFFVFVISYGLMSFLALSALPFVLRAKEKLPLFLFCLSASPIILYVLSAWGLLFVPKIRFADSSPYLYTGILGIWGLNEWLKVGFLRKQAKIITGFVCLVFILNAYLGLKYYWWTAVNLRNVVNNIYIPEENMEVMRYIDMNLPAFSEMLSTYYVGVYLPAFTDMKVYLGHEASTLDFTRKWWEAGQFFGKKFSTDEAKELIKTGKIRYVFWDQGTLPGQYGNLFKEIYRQGSVVIYQVL